MEENRRMTILVLGNSGAGKSTLIEAIAGKEVPIGIGEGKTQSISVYESEIWPLTLIDTKGFEFNFVQQMKTVSQVKKYTKEQIKAEDGRGIDVVWYCIEGTTRRTFAHNIDLMNRAIRGWKGIPVFAVITNSSSEPDEVENIEAVKAAFYKEKGINFKSVIPVVAKEYRINDEVAVPVKGLADLCAQTLQCAEEAKQISVGNQSRLVLEQKRFSAEKTVVGATMAAAAVGAVPIPFPDSFILVPLETGLAKSLLKIYDIDFSGDLVTAIVGSAAITTVARAALNALKTIPNVAGSVINAVVAGFFVFALGESVIALSEEICKGRINKEKIDEVVAFVEEKIGSNAVLAAAIKFLGTNPEKWKGKKAKQILIETLKAVKDAMTKNNGGELKP